MKHFFIFACLLLTTLVVGFADADAATKKKTKNSKPAENRLYAAIVVDAQTGEVLMASKADSIRHPASLTKMMTLYMLFDALGRGQISMNDRIPMTAHAASMSPSKLGIKPGGTITVEHAIRAIVTKSANDVSAAVAEKLGGSERAFASKMTRRAHDLGMSRTTFRNASGLPDPQQVTTARDMAKLAMALLRDHTQYYHYFGIKNFEYRGAIMTNHNRLLGEYPGLDGIKTGFINASGFNLVASAKQNGRRLVGVVFGGRSWRSRNDHMVKLLDEGFAELKRRKSNIQEASVTSPALSVIPIPLPPPMMDDQRGADNALMASTDEDSAENVAYTPADSGRITAMIDQIQEQAQMDDGAADLTAQQTARHPQAIQTALNVMPLNAMPVPLPPNRPSSVDLNPSAGTVSRPPLETKPLEAVPAKSFDTNTSTSANAPGAARTVMQLRIPASQMNAVARQQVVASHTPLAWSIQVGAFPSRAMTDQALRTAQSRLPSHLQGGQPVIVPQSTGSGLIFRARLQGYDQRQANAACAHLGACLVVAPGS